MQHDLTVATPRPPGSPARTKAGWRSLERRLPLIMTGLLALMLAVALGLTYATLAKSARDTMAERLESAASQLGTLTEGVMAGIRIRLRVLATDSTLRRALIDARRGDERAPADPAAAARVTAALARSFIGRPDSTAAVELWTADGRRIAHAGADLRSGVSIADRAADLARIPVRQEGLEALAPSDSVQIGDLYVAGSGAFFWVVAPVFDGGARIGYMARRYRMDQGMRAEDMVHGLVGPDVAAYVHNRDGSVWTSISGEVTSRPEQRDSMAAGLVVSRAGAGSFLAAGEMLDKTPYGLALEIPMAAVMAGPRTTILRLALFSLLLTLVGGIAAWAVSRRITRPIVSLTGAAEAIAQGDYGARVEPRGDDELARLAVSFNRMAEEIGASRCELEMQTEEALASTEELESSNRELLMARAEAEQARAHAEAANRAKSEFLAVMSHELRTPLNAIAGYTELLELELRGPITDAQRRDLSRIRASQQHLLGLISAVLDLSRIEAGRVTYHLAPLALDPFLSSLDALVEPQAVAKSLTLDYQPCGPLIGATTDHEKLRQILLNLLSNAIRYTPPGGRVVFTADAVDESWVVIRVVDTGVGIPEDSLDRIFEPFVQLDRSLTRVRDGIGLGLSISRDLARGMGGELTAESQVGAGSTFSLRLPRAAVVDIPSIPTASGDFPAVAS
jgi:signal transduction histidine kinase